MGAPLGRLLCGAALVAALATGALAPPAAADDGDLGGRLARACARIEPARERIGAVTTRLEAGADVRGSLDWFDAQIARATAANRPKLAADLSARRGVLADRLVVLRERTARLDQAAAFCGRRGVAV